MTEEETKTLKLNEVEFAPQEYVGFNGKIDDVRKEPLSITNTTSEEVAFKLKSTSPDIFKLKPGYGYLKPGANIVITIKLLSLRNRPNPPKRERLVVLLAIAPAEKPKNPADVWRKGEVPKNPLRFVLPLRIEGFDGFKGKPPPKRAKPGARKRDNKLKPKITSSDEDDAENKKKKKEKKKAEKASKKKEENEQESEKSDKKSSEKEPPSSSSKKEED